MNWNCKARSRQNREQLGVKSSHHTPVSVPQKSHKKISTPHIPVKVHSEPYHHVFPPGTDDWYGVGFGVRKSLNQRQKRKIKRQ